MDIYKILPKTNCGECGEPSCLAFAGALSKGWVSAKKCPGLAQPIEEKAVYPVIDKDGRLTSTIELDLPKSVQAREQQQDHPEAVLTERELEVLKLLAQGFTNPQISKQLCISPHTVKSHVAHIYEKLGVNDRAQAAVLAARFNLI
ncbi:MAG: LuxR C-terminal-related transcriptional regulator [Desulfobulbaceae bacterium]|nr:LuxR C-terminal-related transcriptional regulator [Desulfobulbaceae bacterium]